MLGTLVDSSRKINCVRNDVWVFLSHPKFVLCSFGSMFGVSIVNLYLTLDTDPHVIYTIQVSKSCRKGYLVDLIEQAHLLALTDSPIFRRVAISESQCRPRGILKKSKSSTQELRRNLPTTSKPSPHCPHLTSPRQVGRNDVALPQYLPPRRERPSVHM
jgi:hypothetical protein